MTCALAFLVSAPPFFGCKASRVYGYLPKLAGLDTLVDEAIQEYLVDASSASSGSVLPGDANLEAVTGGGAAVYRVQLWGHSFLKSGLFAPTSVARTLSVTIRPALADAPAVADRMEAARTAAIQVARTDRSGLRTYISAGIETNPISDTGELVDRWVDTWWPGYVFNALAFASTLGGVVVIRWMVRRDSLSTPSDPS